MHHLLHVTERSALYDVKKKTNGGEQVKNSTHASKGGKGKWKKQKIMQSKRAYIQRNA